MSKIKKRKKTMHKDEPSSVPPSPENELNQPDSTNQTKNKRTYNVGLLKRQVTFSFPQGLIFILIFGLIGGYAIYKSFAAEPVTDQTAAVGGTHLVLRFKPSATKAQRDKILAGNNLAVINEIPQIGVKVVSVPANAADAVKAALSHNPAVDFVETDNTVKPQEQLPNDPFFPVQSALGGGAWGWPITHTTQAWDITQGNSTVNVAILDTGIKTTGLTDFAGQIGSTWNSMNNTTDATTNAGNHGTYVAGIVGLAINNGVGNAGFCPKCKLMIVQVGTDSGASDSAIAAGLTYAADHGAKVANMSWAGTTNLSATASAVTYARSKGVVVFASAGNSNCDCATYPSASPGVLGVAGIDNSGNKAGDSNYGSWVAIAAPEGNMTAWPTLNGAPGYSPVGGTSSASPAAAGIAGLLFSYNPSLTNTQVEAALENTATGANFTLKYGKIDTLAALQSLGASDPQASSVPVQVVPPQIYYQANGAYSISPLTTAPQPGQVLVRGIGGWTGSTGLSETGLQWQRCNSSGGSCVAITSASTYTVLSTDAGSTIKLIFSVKNGLGSTPASVLSAPVGGTGNTPPPTVSISALPSSITAGQTSSLSWSSTNATTCSASGAWSGSQPVSGSLAVSPSANSTYTLTCTGTGGTASATATVLVSPAVSPPATPTGFAPTPLDKSVTLTWTANTEADLASYDLQYKPTSSATWTMVSNLTGVTYTVPGLTNGTSYDFQLRAKNTSAQFSAWTATVSATPQGSQPADTTPPTATITSPLNGSNITGLKKVRVAASATDNNVVIKIELYIDGSLKTTVTTPALNYSWTINRNVASGNHTITVKAYDAAGNIGQSSVTVTK